MIPQFKQFQDLSTEELYQIIKLRVDVFVVEQECPYPELDDQDQDAIHIQYKEGNVLAAYARILQEKGHWHIGRIVVASKHRKKGLAKRLMMVAENYCKDQLGVKEIHLSAQTYLQAFYSSLGYQVYSQPYDWDGIDHIDMKKLL